MSKEKHFQEPEILYKRQPAEDEGLGGEANLCPCLFAGTYLLVLSKLVEVISFQKGK